MKIKNKDEINFERIFSMISDRKTKVYDNFKI